MEIKVQVPPGLQAGDEFTVSVSGGSTHKCIVPAAAPLSSDAAHVLNYFQSGTGQLTEDAESAQQGITRT